MTLSIRWMHTPVAFLLLTFSVVTVEAAESCGLKFNNFGAFVEKKGAIHGSSKFTDYDGKISFEAHYSVPGLANWKSCDSLCTKKFKPVLQSYMRNKGEVCMTINPIGNIIQSHRLRLASNDGVLVGKGDDGKSRCTCYGDYQPENTFDSMPPRNSVSADDKKTLKSTIHSEEDAVKKTVIEAH